MQKEMIRDIENARPDLIVFVEARVSWLPYPKSNGLIFDWLKRYLSRQYHLSKIFDIVSVSSCETNPEIMPASSSWNNRLLLFQADRSPLGVPSGVTIH